jgi:hypothetical protein
MSVIREIEVTLVLEPVFTDLKGNVVEGVVTEESAQALVTVLAERLVKPKVQKRVYYGRVWARIGKIGISRVKIITAAQSGSVRVAELESFGIKVPKGKKARKKSKK